MVLGAVAGLLKLPAHPEKNERVPGDLLGLTMAAGSVT
jgi:hypothetical protein